MLDRSSDKAKPLHGERLVARTAVALPAVAGITPYAPTPAFGLPGGGCCGGQASADGERVVDQVAERSGNAPHSRGTAATATLLIDLKNTKCPVMGGTPDGKSFSEWRGLRIGHCCGVCPSKFAYSPEQSMEDSGIEWHSAATAVKDFNEAKGAARATALAELRGTWTVVREPTAACVVAPGTLVDLANTNCPVRGAAVDGNSFSEWNGVRVGFCCPECIVDFASHPEKYLDDAELPWRAAAEAVSAVDQAEGAARAKALETLSKMWKVVREPAAEQSTK